jgi:CubicO group peptidase (beta-lactamase class C family)
MRIGRTPVIIALAVALAGAIGIVRMAQGQTAARKEELPHPKTLEELQSGMKQVLEKEHVPGAGVALVSNGELLWCGGLGKASVAGNRDVSCDTEFRVGSISKTFVALALLKLEEEGKINLQARLQDVAPEVPVNNRWEATNPVRIVNLLEHTAGFDDMEFSEVYNRRDRYDYPLLDVFQRFREPQNARWPPGMWMSYSNPGYGVAGYLIEKITHRPFDEYIRDTIISALQMESADFRFTDANRALLAEGYDGNPLHPVGYPQIYLRPAGDLKASPGELAKLVQFFLRRGRAGETQLLKPESIARMEVSETTAAARHGLRIGYGLGNYTDVRGGIVTHGHDGLIDGFLSTYRYMPEQNWGFVMLLNSTNSGKALADLDRWAIDFLSKGFPKPRQPAINLSSSELKRLSGYYASRAPLRQLLGLQDELFGGARYRVIDGKLTWSRFNGMPKSLVPVSKSIFREEEEPEGTIVFFTDEKGKMFVSGGGRGGMSCGERSSLLVAYGRIAGLCLCLVLMATSVPFAVIWIPWKLFGGMKGVRHLNVRILPLLASLCSVVIPFFFSPLSDPKFGTLNPWTFGIFLATLLFPILSVLGLLLASGVPRDEIKKGVRIHSLLVSLACCTVAAYLASWGWVAVRLWAP